VQNELEVRVVAAHRILYFRGSSFACDGVTLAGMRERVSIRYVRIEQGPENFQGT
jgi:hypothetical protein